MDTTITKLCSRAPHFHQHSVVTEVSAVVGALTLSAYGWCPPPRICYVHFSSGPPKTYFHEGGPATLYDLHGKSFHEFYYVA